MPAPLDEKPVHADAKPVSKAGFDIKLWGPFLALVVVALLGFGVNSTFIGMDNVTNVLTRTAFIGIIAVGATFVITSGGLDLSVGSLAAFLSGLMIMVMNYLANTAGLGTGWLTILIGMGVAVLAGVLAGGINGAIITRGRIEPFIVTLGTMGIYRSLVTYSADGGTLTLSPAVRDTYRPVYYEGIWGIPYPILAFLVVAILGYILLNKTRFGRYCAAIGSNETVAGYSAINVIRIKMMAYVLQGMCVAVATILYVPRLGSASATTGLLWELEAIAAVIIGGTALRGGFGRVWGTVAGAVILSMISNILNLTDFISNHLNGAIQGIIIIVAVLLQRGGVTRR